MRRVPSSPPRRKPLLWLTVAALCLTWAVMLLGAYVRLTDAGLGCPDWPGCYGQALAPPPEQAAAWRAAAPDRYAARPYDAGKARREMIHRYGGGGLGLLILALTALAGLRARPHFPLALTTLAVVILQGLLGMWTVTLLLQPLIVAAHLLGGMLILSLLFLLLLRQTAPDGMFSPPPARRLPAATPFAWLMLLALIMQIFLGGWTSGNYAALICPQFPQCRDGLWLPPVDFAQAFTLWRGPGMNYEGGVLDAAARTAIHLAHRAGALLVLLLGLALGLRLLRVGGRAATRLAAIMLCLLAVQIMLGVGNIAMALPLSLALAHNGVAALLLLSVVAVVYFCRGPRAA